MTGSSWRRALQLRSKVTRSTARVLALDTPFHPLRFAAPVHLVAVRTAGFVGCSYEPTGPCEGAPSQFVCAFQAGISFAVGMQKSVMQIAMPPELASHQAFGAKMGSSGQVKRSRGSWTFMC